MTNHREAGEFGEGVTVSTPSGSIDVEGLRAKAEAATPTEWHLSLKNEDEAILGPSYEIGSLVRGIAGQMYAKDAAYIVAAQPSTVLALIDRIEALERALKPFEACADYYAPDGYADDQHVINTVTYRDGEQVTAILRRGDFRLARTTLSGDTK